MRLPDLSLNRALTLGLYSERYPAIGESHGLSVAAGQLEAAGVPVIVLDRVVSGEEDCTDIADVITRNKIDILAIGLPYGTYTVLVQNYAPLRAALSGEAPLVVFGGPIATYLGDRLLREVDAAAVVVVGESEDALPRLVDAWRSGRDYRDVPNLHYIDSRTGKEVRTRRRLVDLTAVRPPSRSHIPDIRRRGGQVFVESSRGCSWAACTFCLRGLTDVTGRSQEYRRRPPGAVLADLRVLHAFGVDEVTFADEDLIGSSLDEAENFVSGLERGGMPLLRFDASLTVHSVYSRRDDTRTSIRRVALLRRLAALGLRKGFLGIESCSPSQLRRYAKGHTREEAAGAAARLHELGIRVEIGVILFDPLCTLDEIADSLEFMSSAGLTALASGISSELRLQTASHYLAIIDKYEARHGVRLRSRTLDPDTLSYSYDFADDMVRKLFRAVGKWNDLVHPLYYPAKSLTRFGADGAIGGATAPIRRATETFRLRSSDAVLAAISALQAGGEPEGALDEVFTPASRDLAEAVRTALANLPSSVSEHPVILRVKKVANSYGTSMDLPKNLIIEGTLVDHGCGSSA